MGGRKREKYIGVTCPYFEPMFSKWKILIEPSDDYWSQEGTVLFRSGNVPKHPYPGIYELGIATLYYNEDLCKCQKLDPEHSIIAVYVGETKNLRKRLQCHGRPGCSHLFHERATRPLIGDVLRRGFPIAFRYAVGEDGEIIDCFDIYKQPAFDHPLLQNHTIQMKPSSYPNGIKADDFKFELIQPWQKNEKCPAGTIPIRRARQSNFSTLPVPSFSSKRDQKPHHKNHNFTILAQQDAVEFALVSVVAERFYGAQTIINLWKPTLGTSSEFSISQICVTAGSQKDGTFNSAHAGWIINPKLYGDDEPRYFVYWTSVKSKSIRGCFNLLCPGFVQTNTQFDFGTIIGPVSVYDGPQFGISVVIFKDENVGHWWVKLQDHIIGYWPSSIFTTLSQGATNIQWGGAILNTHPDGHHTTTEMGSGEFPSKGFRKASFFRNLRIIDENNTLRDPENLEAFSTKSKCYDVHIEDDTKSEYGYHFFYGGFGFSDNYCP